MKSHSKKANKRSRRYDGDITKMRIIEAAGMMYAERGFAYVTGKEICKKLKINITSVNYHFGSREDLHETVIRTALDFIIKAEFITELSKIDMPSREKLIGFIHSLAEMDSTCWQVRVCAKEIVAPSDLWNRIVFKENASSFLVVKEILSDATGIPIDEPKLTVYLFYFVAPVILFMISPPSTVFPKESAITEHSSIIRNDLESVIFAGLDRLTSIYAERSKAPE